MTHEPWTQPTAVTRAAALIDSYRRVTGRDLVPSRGTAEEKAAALFSAPFVVVAHGTHPDPVLDYGNRVALDLWEADWETLTAMPSRLTAEPVHRDERARLLDRVTRHGFIDDYSGVRISRTGRRFLIERAVVWNVTDADGAYLGQAATFATWRFLDADAGSPSER